MRNVMQIKKLVLLLSAILIVNCAGTAPSVGEKIENQQSNKSETKIVDEEVKVDSMIMFGDVNNISLNKGLILGTAVGFARDLGNHPANILTTSYLAKAA